MQFRARAVDAASQQVLDVELEAADEADARAQLHTRQLVALSLRPARALALARRGERFSVELFAQELHALTQAGLGLVESLEAFHEKERGAETRAVLERLIAALHNGQRFSTALRAQGAVFPPLFTGVVEAAENTGELAGALERFIGYSQSVQAVRQRMVSAAIYPAILLVVGGLVAVFLMGWVVPRFSAVYLGSPRELPWGSQLLLDWGRFVGQHGWALGGSALAVLGLGGLLLWRALQQGGLAAVARVVPGMARWIELMTLSRLFLTLGLLLRGGLPVQQALGLARSVLPAGRADAVDRVLAQVTEGQALSAALDEAGLATPVSRRFVRAGERSGQLAEMLSRAAAYHDAETARWVERFSRTFEPVLMAAIGAVIGGIVLLLYMPIFDLAGSLQ